MASAADLHPAPVAPRRNPGWLELLKRAADGWVEDGASSMGAALAFYALFSLAPLLLVALWVAGLFAGRDEAQAMLVAQLTAIVGETAALAVEGLMDTAATPSEGFLPAMIGAFTIVIGATTVFSELRTQLNRIWRAPEPKHTGVMRFLMTRCFAFLLVVGIGLLLIGSMLLSAFFSAAGDLFFARSRATITLMDFAASMLVVTTLFAMIYKVLPSVRIAWRDVWVGAAITSALFWAGKWLIALYLAKAGVQSGFGAAGAVVLVVLWVYYSAQIFFFGAEVTREWARRRGSHQGDPIERRAGTPIVDNGNFRMTIQRRR